MSYAVKVETVAARTILAVRASVRIGEVAKAFGPPLDKVWAYLRANPQVKREHNLFLYHHPAQRGDPMEVDFGVEVLSPCAGEGDVRCVTIPAGEAAIVLHVGPYDQMRAAHEALHAWCAANGKRIGACSWEVYGDWSDDPAKLETTIYYLLV